MFAPVGNDGWPARVRLPAFTLSSDDLAKAKARTAQLLRPRTPASEAPRSATSSTPPPQMQSDDLAERPHTTAAEQGAPASATDTAAGDATPGTPPPSAHETASTLDVKSGADANDAEAAQTTTTQPSEAAGQGKPTTSGKLKPPQDGPLYLRLYDDARRIEQRRQEQVQSHRRESRTAERENCTFSPVISPHARRQRRAKSYQAPQHRQQGASVGRTASRPAGASARPSTTTGEASLNATRLSASSRAPPSPSPSPGVSPRKGGSPSVRTVVEAPRRQPDERVPSEFVFERLYGEASTRAARLSQKRAHSLATIEDESGQECTFTPQISPRARRSHHYENFDDFLTAQEEHRLVHQNQLRRLTQQMDEEANGRGTSSASPQPRSRAASTARTTATNGAAAVTNPVAAKLKAALEADPRYKGPISGWHERAEAYWRARNGDASAAPGQSPQRGTRSRSTKSRTGCGDGESVHTRLYKEHAQKEAMRQSVALAQLAQEHAELFKPRLSGTEAFTTRRHQSRPAAQDSGAVGPSEAPTRRSQGEVETVFDDLYDQGLALHRRKQAQQLSEEEARIAGCPFTPQVNPESERILIDLAVKVARGNGEETSSTAQAREGENEEKRSNAASRRGSPRSVSHGKQLATATGGPHLHVLRLAQYRRQSQPPSLSPARGAISDRTRSASAGTKKSTSRSTKDFLSRNAELLQRRHDRVAALKQGEAAEDLEHCTFRPTLAPLTEAMADDQQRYLQLVDSPEVRRDGWWRYEGSLSPSASPRARQVSGASRLTSPRAHAVATAQRLPYSGTPAAGHDHAAAHGGAASLVDAPVADGETVLASTPRTHQHRPRVIPVAVPYGSHGGVGQRLPSARSTRSSAHGGGASRDGTPLRSSHGPLYPHRTPLHALLHGATPVTVGEHDGWVPAGGGGDSGTEGTTGAETQSPAVISAASHDYLRTLEAELDATLERWTELA